MGKSKHRKVSSFEIIIGASAVLVSLCALFVSISQVRLMQKQMHLTVMPRIDISFSNIPSDDLNISITNCGLGPAEILATKIEYNSVAVGSWEEMFRMMSKEQFEAVNYSAAKLKDRMLVPLQIFPILVSKEDTLYKLFEANKDKIKITIFYKSLYNDYFEVCRENLSVSGAITNQNVDRCSFSEKETFQR